MAGKQTKQGEARPPQRSALPCTNTLPVDRQAVAPSVVVATTILTRKSLEPPTRPRGERADTEMHPYASMLHAEARYLQRLPGRA